MLFPLVPFLSAALLQMLRAPLSAPRLPVCAYACLFHRSCLFPSAAVSCGSVSCPLVQKPLSFCPVPAYSLSVLMASAILLRLRHCSLEISLFSVWCSQGASSKSFPSAQASKAFPCGFSYCAKPFSLKTTVGQPLSKARLITSFSPGETEAETNTEPFSKSGLALCKRAARSASEIRREHCT